jgi:hypothetical protein
MFDIDGTLTELNALDDASYLQALSEVFSFSEVLINSPPSLNSAGLLVLIHLLICMV